MADGSPKAQISGNKAALLGQRVEDNAFHLEARSHSRHPPPVIRSPKIVKKIVKKKY